MADKKKPQAETKEPAPPALPEEAVDTGEFRAAMAQVIDQRISQLEGSLPVTIRRIVRDELIQMMKLSNIWSIKVQKYLDGLIDMDTKE